MATNNLETNLFILRAFLTANPIYALSLCNHPFYKDNLAEPAMRILCSRRCTTVIFGLPLRIQEFFNRIDKPQNLSLCPIIVPVSHVFPVYVKEFDTSFMVPLQVTPNDEWQISDAFGTFGFVDVCQKSISQVFDGLLQRIEQAWLALHPGHVLPLRWRKSFALKLLCPIHFDAIEGESLQVPLVISLLRAMCQEPESERFEAVMPFGNGPVFASGTLLKDNSFGSIINLKKKIEGFIREYGEKLPAILTTGQINTLNSTDEGKSLLDNVVVYCADNLNQLLALEGLHKGLKRLCEAPHPTEIDELLSSMQRMKKGVRFDDAEAMSRWLLPYVKSPVYYFQLLRQVGMVLTHRGMLIDAHSWFLQASDILSNNSKWFGISEKIQLATAWGTLAFDAFDPSLAESQLRAAEAELSYASAADRARFWGTCCQIYRLSGQLDEAINAGYQSIQFTDIALASEGGRGRNYLIHALITRARYNPDTKQNGLKEASELLRQSNTEWVPLDNSAAKRVHLGFCLQYEGEIARLQEKAFKPPNAPSWFGTWGHPWLFVLLSCARNTVHNENIRICYAQDLVSYAEKWAERYPDSIFIMLLLIYRLYLGALKGENLIVPLDDLEKWCKNMEARGFSGWKCRLCPTIEMVRKGIEGSVEMLCDAIPYH